MCLNQNRTTDQLRRPDIANGVFPDQFGKDQKQHQRRKTAFPLIQQMHTGHCYVGAMQYAWLAGIGFNIG